jgi:hypothetical protein
MRRDKSCGPRLVRPCVESPEDFRETFRVRGVGSKEARGIHARLAVHRVDDKTRILRDRPQAAVFRPVQCLQSRILLEGSSSLFRLRDGRDVRQTHDVDRNAGEERADFA